MAKPLTDWANIDWHRPSIDIIEDLNCSREAVIRNRRKYAPETIGKYNYKHCKTSPIYNEPLLGVKTDQFIADKYNVSCSRVQKIRKDKGIPAAPHNSRNFFYTQEFWNNLPLGKIPDIEIADTYKCCVGTVKRARDYRNIPPYGSSD